MRIWDINVACRFPRRAQKMRNEAANGWWMKRLCLFVSSKRLVSVVKLWWMGLVFLDGDDVADEWELRWKCIHLGKLVRHFFPIWNVQPYPSINRNLSTKPCQLDDWSINPTIPSWHSHSPHCPWELGKKINSIVGVVLWMNERSARIVIGKSYILTTSPNWILALRTI